MINMYCLTISPILSSIPKYTAHISKLCIVGGIFIVEGMDFIQTEAIS
jgi:hypothetical protein